MHSGDEKFKHCERVYSKILYSSSLEQQLLLSFCVSFQSSIDSLAFFSVILTWAKTVVFLKKWNILIKFTFFLTFQQCI